MTASHALDASTTIAAPAAGSRTAAMSPAAGTRVHILDAYGDVAALCGVIVGDAWYRMTEWVPAAGGSTVCLHCLRAERKIAAAALTAEAAVEYLPEATGTITGSGAYVPDADDAACAKCGTEVSLGGSVEFVDGVLSHGWDCVAEPVQTVAPSARAEAEAIDTLLARVLDTHPTVAAKIARAETRAANEEASTRAEVTRTLRFRRDAGGYAVASAGTDYHDVRPLGTVRRLSQAHQTFSPKWQATAPDGTNLGTHYRTRVEAAQALLVTADRVAALDALPTDDAVEVLLDEVEARADAEHVEVVEHEAFVAELNEEAAKTRAEVTRTEGRRAVAPAPRHWTREEVLDRLHATGGFDLVLGPDDTAYDLEVGDTMLGGVTLRYAYGEFPGTAYRTIVLDDEQPAVDDDPREQPAPVEWSEAAALFGE